jgi:gas vesicle protein
MKAATVNDIKQELGNLSAKQLTDICLRLAKFKKENKELLTYLLFEANDEPAYINLVKQEIDEQYTSINDNNLYWAKKSLRKILRIANKHIRYIGTKPAEVELLIYFCTRLKESGIPFQKSTVLNNLYNQQLKKIKAAIATFHEDLQYDYLRELNKL